MVAHTTLKRVNTMIAFDGNAILKALNNTLTTDLSFENKQLVVSEQGVTMTVNFTHRWLHIKVFSENNARFFETNRYYNSIAHVNFDFERTTDGTDVNIVGYGIESARLNNAGIEFATIAAAHNELAIANLMIAQATSFYVNNSEALETAAHNAIVKFYKEN